MTGLMVASAAALRININTHGRPIPTNKRWHTSNKLCSHPDTLLQAAGSEPSGFVSVPMPRIETRLLDSLGHVEGNREYLACLPHPGFYFVGT